MQVEKRDGTRQDFNFDKIERVVNRVYKSIKQKTPEKFIEELHEVFDKLIEKTQAKKPGYAIPIEEIQDIIRNQFIKKNQTLAAESFILYRDKREKVRQQKSWLNKEITRKLKGNDVENQNANLDEASFGGRIGEASRVITKDYALKYIVSKMARKNHEGNMIYIHDLDSYAVGMHNCLSFPFEPILSNGFNTRQTDVRSAGSINTASQLVAVCFQLQSLQQFGGVSATHIDWTMVPYVRKSFMKHYIIHNLYEADGFMNLDIDNISEEKLNKWVSKRTAEFFLDNGLTEEDFRYDNVGMLDPIFVQRAKLDTRKETYQAVEGMYHNLNTLQSRSGNQLPFTSINYGTCTIPEGRLFTRALLEVSLKGTGKFGRTSIFPCGIFQYMKGVNDKPGTPNYDLYRLALKSTSKRLYPNYANNNWSVNDAAIEYDRKVRKEVIESLDATKYLRLHDIIAENSEVGKRLYLHICGNDDEYIGIEREAHPIEYFSTMGCRTANGGDINFKHSFEMNIKRLIETNGKEWYDDYESAAQKDGRGNICPVTIIMPTIAKEASNAVIATLDKNQEASTEEYFNKFMEMLDVKIAEARDMLIERFNYIASQSPASAKFMYENHTMAGYVPEEGIISALRHGTLAIGQIGLAETLQILLGFDHTTERGMEYAKKIEELFNKRCAEFKTQYNLNFGVYLTPAESLCYTSFKKWKDKYGESENVTYYYDKEGVRHDKLYFTNSIHVPVYIEMSPFKKIGLESELTGYSNAGCITYVEVLHDAIHNIDALEELVNNAMENDIPYFAINLPSDTCNECGYQGLIGDTCPKCGSTNIDRLRRVTGYLTGDYHNAFNPGKVVETDQRAKHKDEIKF